MGVTMTTSWLTLLTLSPVRHPALLGHTIKSTVLIIWSLREYFCGDTWQHLTWLSCTKCEVCYAKTLCKWCSQATNKFQTDLLLKENTCHEISYFNLTLIFGVIKCFIKHSISLKEFLRWQARSISISLHLMIWGALHYLFLPVCTVS